MGIVWTGVPPTPSFAKDQTIALITKEKNNLNGVVSALKTQYAELRTKFEKLKSNEKDELKLARRKSEEMIRTKSKAKKGKGSIEELPCEYPDCENKSR